MGVDEKPLDAVPQKVKDSNPVGAIITALVKATPWYVSDAMARKKLANLEKMLGVAYGKEPALIKELAPKIDEICKDKKLGEALLDSLGEVGKRFKGVNTENAAKMLLQVVSDMKASRDSGRGFTPEDIAHIAKYMTDNYDYDKVAQKLVPVTRMVRRQPI